MNKALRLAALRLVVGCFAIVCISNLFAQGDDTPTGAAGGFGGSVSTGGGSFDPYERNASRSVTDLVVPGAVVPFTYTRIWNSRSRWGNNNWYWWIEEHTSTELGGGAGPNDLFHGYYVHYPDGRVVQFHKPGPDLPSATPGTYTNDLGVVDRFVIDADSHHGHLYMSDGSVMNFDIAPEQDGKVTSIDDPHGRRVTYTYDSPNDWYTFKVTEPGGRWIHIGNDGTVTTSLGQSISFTATTSGSYPAGIPAGTDTGMYSPSIGSREAVVIYNDVLDPATGQPVESHWVYKQVMPAPPRLPSDPPTEPIMRLVWASDPMFDGPLQQIKYLYVDNTTQIWGDPLRNEVIEERSATSVDDPGVTVTRIEMPNTATWSPTTGNNNDFYDRVETHGDGVARTLTYRNSAGGPQKVVDHLTDFSNNPSQIEKREYDFTHYFQTPTKITDMRNNATNQTLESVCGHVTRETHPDTNYRSWTYSDSAHPYYVATKTDELGRTISYTRDPNTHLVTRIDYPGGTYETFTYNGFGQVTDHRLASGAHLYQTFDSRGLKTSSSDSVSGEVTTYTYDSWDRLATVRDARAAAMGIPYSVKYEYNGRHQITKMHYPPTGGSPDPTVTYTYDKWGHCTSVTDELGNTRTMTYDEYGRCTSYTEPLGAPAWNGAGAVINRTWNWTYERVRNGTTYAANRHVSKQWRTQTEPVFNKNGDRRMIVRDYDVNDRLTREETFTVHSNGTTDFTDGQTHLYEYDLNGNKTKYTDPQQRVTTYGYDLRNRLTTTTEPLNRITTTAYDAASNKTQVTFPDTKTQKWLGYDAFGQPGQFIDERNNTTDLTYQWGPMKKLATVTTHRTKDVNGIENQVTTFSYDGIGRPTRVLFPDGSDEVTTYLYDRVNTWKTRRGPIKTISYDARGRETSHSWNDPDTPGITRLWDDADHVTSLSNVNSTINYVYDQAGQVTSESNNITGALLPGTISYFRYPNGAPATVIYPNGSRVRRDYTAREQLSATGSSDSNGEWLTKFVQYYYMPDGKLEHENLGNGLTTGIAYDARGMSAWVQHYRPSPYRNYTARTYYRDNRDRIYAWEKSYDNSATPLENGRGDRYTYDAEGQLTAASYQAINPSGTPTSAQRSDNLVYDEMGNRKGDIQVASMGATHVTRRDNGLNQYVNWNLPIYGTQPVNYDDIQYGAAQANGVLVQDGWITAPFNALNQPIYMWSHRTNPTGDAIYFYHDPLGRCVKRTKKISVPLSGLPVAPDGPPTFYYYEGWNLIQEGLTPLNPDRTYVHGGRVDEIVVSQANGQTYYHHYDARGHCIMLTDPTGSIAEQYDYDAFGWPYFFNGSGAPLTNGSAVGNRFLFTGREWLNEVAVYDFRNRHYLPELGRFMQPDPKQFDAGDYNLYRYCHNDPVNKSDPFGLLTVEWIAIPTHVELPQHVYSDAGTDLPARTYSDVKATTKADKNGNLDKLTVYHSITVKYAQAAGPKTRAFAKGDVNRPDKRPGERAHEFELRGWGAGSGTDLAQAVAQRFVGRSAVAAEKEANRVLQKDLARAMAESHLTHDIKNVRLGDHVSPYRYEE